MYTTHIKRPKTGSGSDNQILKFFPRSSTYTPFGSCAFVRSDQGVFFIDAITHIRYGINKTTKI